jgi:hypothetical protein
MTDKKNPEDYGITRPNIDYIFTLEHRVGAEAFTKEDVNSLTSAYSVD